MNKGKPYIPTPKNTSPIKLIKKLQNMSERDLTLEVLIPLFQNLGFDRVEHHGVSI